MKNNFYFFFLNKIFLKNNDLNLLNDLKKNIIKLYSLKKNYKISNYFLNIVNTIYFLNLKYLNENSILKKNQENIYFFFFNNKFYDKSFLNIIVNDNFLNYNFKNYYFTFFHFNLYSIKKFIYILKLKFFLKKCQL
jgi:hypothetical protein